MEILEEYKNKIERYQKLEFLYLKEFSSVSNLLKNLGKEVVYLMDEEGKSFDSKTSVFS